LGSADPLQIAKSAAEFGGCVFVVDPHDGYAMSLVGLLEQLGRVIVDNEVDSIASTLRNENLLPKGVVTFAESGVEIANGLANSFQLPSLTRGEPNALFDKFAQRTVLNAAFGEKGTSVALLKDGVPPDFKFPAFVKPRRGAGSRNTMSVAREEDLRDSLAKLGDNEELILEEALIGEAGHVEDWLADYVSVESLVQSSVIYTIGITGRLPSAWPARETGLIFPLVTVQPLRDQLVTTSNRAIAALGIENGIVHTELKLCHGGPRIIEVNPRIGGHLARLMPWTIGVSPITLAMKLASGIRIDVDGTFQETRKFGAKMYIQPPFDAVQLVRSPPIEEVRRVKGVKRIDSHAEMGDLLDWRKGSGGRILDVYVVCPTLQELSVSVKSVNDLIHQASIYREVEAG
jgi:hypothetical protein